MKKFIIMLFSILFTNAFSSGGILLAANIGIDRPSEYSIVDMIGVDDRLKIIALRRQIEELQAAEGSAKGDKLQSIKNDIQSKQAKLDQLLAQSSQVSTVKYKASDNSSDANVTTSNKGTHDKGHFDQGFIKLDFKKLNREISFLQKRIDFLQDKLSTASEEMKPRIQKQINILSAKLNQYQTALSFHQQPIKLLNSMRAEIKKETDPTKKAALQQDYNNLIDKFIVPKLQEKQSKTSNPKEQAAIQKQINFFERVKYTTFGEPGPFGPMHEQTATTIKSLKAQLQDPSLSADEKKDVKRQLAIYKKGIEVQTLQNQINVSANPIEKSILQDKINILNQQQNILDLRRQLSQKPDDPSSLKDELKQARQQIQKDKNKVAHAQINYLKEQLPFAKNPLQRWRLHAQIVELQHKLVRNNSHLSPENRLSYTVKHREARQNAQKAAREHTNTQLRFGTHPKK